MHTIVVGENIFYDEGSPVVVSRDGIILPRRKSLNATATASSPVVSAPARLVFPDISVIIGLKMIMDPFNPNIPEVDKLTEVAKSEGAFDPKDGWNIEKLAKRVLRRYSLHGFSANWEEPCSLQNALSKLQQSVRSGLCLTLLHGDPSREDEPNFVIPEKICRFVKYELISMSKPPAKKVATIADFLSRWRRQVIVVAKTRN